MVERLPYTRTIWYHTPTSRYPLERRGTKIKKFVWREFTHLYEMDNVNIRLLDNSKISKEIGKTENACRQKLQSYLRYGIYKHENEREILIAKLSTIPPDENVPMKMRSAQLYNMNGMPTKDLDRILEKGHCGVPPK
jgi:hypothetical protein